MTQLSILAIKAVAGGIGVVAFALVAEVVEPKKLAGLFAAAPSVALASMVVTVLDTGPQRTVPAALGMAAGSVGMLAFCLLGVPAIGRLGATLGSVAALAGWLAVALALYLVFLR